MAAKIGIDTGGTHTDVVLVDRDRDLFRTLKVATTPQNLSIGILEGVERILGEVGLSEADVDHFVYGTTYVTNLIVEQKNVDVGLITTEGFRDILAIGRATRKENIYDINWRPLPAVVPRRHRLTVVERINADGGVETPLDRRTVIAALDKLAEAGVASIAVCLLHAYVNPAHEREIKRIAAELYPQLTLSLSSEIVREFREYERSSTTAINAYVMRSMRDHLGDLAGSLARRGVTARPHIMRGNGGITSFARGGDVPVAITHSGPVAGIVGGNMLAKAAGFSSIITFDMGGTSSDIALVTGGEPTITTRGRLAGYPVMLPIVDLVTIGAGGGSIARIDGGGRLLVGPQSAGSVPGPMCYGQGGTNPTISDANLEAGRLNAGYFLAGTRKIDAGLSTKGLAERIAGPLGMTTAEAALGILDIAEAHMTNAIKLVSVQRGVDPRDYTLVAFGGAGPLHAIALAEALGMRSVLIPPAPGNVSASGLLCAEIRQDVVRTLVSTADRLPAERLRAVIDELSASVAELLEADGLPAEAQQMVLTADLRYAGQSHELNVPVTMADLDQPGFAPLCARFIGRHKAMFGYEMPERPIEIVNLRASGFGIQPGLPWPKRDAAARAAVPVAHRVVHHRSRARPSPWPIYRVGDMAPGAAVEGAAIVEYPGSTLVVPPGWSARYDDWMNAIVVRL